MGLAVSIFDGKHPSEPTNSSTKAQDSSGNGARPDMPSHPNHIPIPSPYFSAMSITPSPSHRLEDPFASPLMSPALFFTAPSSPIPSPMGEEGLVFQVSTLDVYPSCAQTQASGASSPRLHFSGQQNSSSPLMSPRYFPPASSPLSVSSSPEANQSSRAHVHATDTDEVFPDVPDIEMALDDEGMDGLNPLEKIYLYSISKATYHRVYICRDLPNLLDLISPQEAVEYVLPLLHLLSKDQDESVREALTVGLSSVIWWFLTHCQMTEDVGDPVDLSISAPTISVDAFTLILGRLVLSPNGVVGTYAKAAVVDLLDRLREADHAEHWVDFQTTASSSEDPNSQVRGSMPRALRRNESHHEDESVSVGYFDKERRNAFEHEILSSLIAGLDSLSDAEPAIYESAEGTEQEEEEEYSQEDKFFEVDEWRGAITDVTSDSSGDSIRIPSRDLQRAENINPYFPAIPPKCHDPQRPSGSPNTPHSESSSSATPSTPSSGFSVSTRSSDSDTLLPPVERTDTVREPPPPRISLPPPPANLQSTRPSSPSYLPVGPRTSPRASPLHQITPDPHMSQYAALTQQRSTSPAQQLPPMHDLHLAGATSPNLLSTGSENLNDSISIRAAADMSELEDDTEAEQQAVKRMASVNLMALVTSKGCLDTSAQATFIPDIERLSADPIPWVRRESTFAIGALAKTIPEELVHISLLPLLEGLIADPHPHVRHSSLFALPGVLSRLPLKQRKAFALQSVNALAMDADPDVRSGVLESLGEIIYTFHSDEPLPQNEEPALPDELLAMFMGQRNDLRWKNGQQPFDRDKGDHLKSFYADPSRPLITAFNFPAVTKTLGRGRWDSPLRETYLRLSNNPAFGVRRTLAASVGDMAQILGPQIAERDLMGVWCDSVDTQDAEIRMKAVDCLSTFFDAMRDHGKHVILEKVVETWKVGQWTGWKEREAIALKVSDIFQSILRIHGDQSGLLSLVCVLVVCALGDNVSAVREAAIRCLPSLWPIVQRDPRSFQRLRSDLLDFARADNSRRRMTYISCQQILLLPSGDGEVLVNLDDELSKPLRSLATDSIIGVRIGVARLAALLFSEQQSREWMDSSLIDLVKAFSQETSREVMLYVPDLSRPRSIDHSMPSSVSASEHPSDFAVFSRPPPHPRLPSVSSGS